MEISTPVFILYFSFAIHFSPKGVQQQQQHAHLKTHYRGHQIAVWLQLIPSLHQPIGESIGSHHTFDQHNTPADQFYEGLISLIID